MIDIKIKKVNKRLYKVQIDSVEYPGLMPALQALDIPDTTYYNCIKRGMTQIEAIKHILNYRERRDENKRERNKPVFDKNGKSYQCLRAAAEEKGLSYNTVYARVRNGWTIEESLAYGPNEKLFKNRERLAGGNAGEEIEIDGHKFASINDALKIYGIKKGAYKYRMKAGWTLEETFLIPKHCSLNRKLIFKLNKKKYYGWKCDYCQNMYVFTEEEIRKHVVEHIKSQVHL